MTVNNRIHPRVKAHFPVEVTAGDGVKLEVFLENVSINGLMIVASQYDFETILVNSRGLQLNKPVEADLRFSLHDKDKPANGDIQVRCRAVYVRRQSQNKYFIGFKFLKISQHNQQLVTRYVNDNLGPGAETIAC